MTIKPETEVRDCYACGGEGWLPSLPEGRSNCHYCDGTGKQLVRKRPPVKTVKP